MTISTNRVIFIYLLINYLFAIDYLVLTPESLNDAAEEIREIYSSSLETGIKIIDSMDALAINEYINEEILNHPDLKNDEIYVNANDSYLGIFYYF